MYFKAREWAHDLLKSRRKFYHFWPVCFSGGFSQVVSGDRSYIHQCFNFLSTYSHSKLQNCLLCSEAVVHHSLWWTISSRKGEDILGSAVLVFKCGARKPLRKIKKIEMNKDESENVKEWRGEPQRIKIQRLNRAVWKSTGTSKYLQLFIVEFQAISQCHLHLYKV